MAIPADTALRRAPLPGIRGLIKKDLAVFIPRDRFLIALVYLLAHPMVLPNEEAFFWLGISLAGALALYVPTIEWHQETDRMLSSLPLRRTTVVFSRYLSSVLACALAAVAWVSSGRILVPLLDAGFAAPGMWTTLEGILAFLLMAGLLLSLFLPLYFRYGIGRGAVVFVGMSFVFFVLASFPFGLVAPGQALRAALGNLRGQVGSGWVLLLILGGMAVLTAVSGRLSVGWFQKRDL